MNKYINRQYTVYALGNNMGVNGGGGSKCAPNIFSIYEYFFATELQARK